MITPEEIRKGLRACTNDAYGCSKRCPYFNALSNGVDCATNMHNDALAYINQLEADNARKQKRIDELEARLAQVEKENAALLHDLKTADQECLFCKRNKFPDEN